MRKIKTLLWTLRGVRVEMESDRLPYEDGTEVEAITERIDNLRGVQEEVSEITSLIEGPQIPDTVGVTVEVEDGHRRMDDTNRVVISVGGGVEEFGGWLDILYEVTDWDRFEINGRSLTARKLLDI